MKKLIALLVSFCLVIGVCVSAFAADNGKFSGLLSLLGIDAEDAEDEDITSDASEIAEKIIKIALDYDKNGVRGEDWRMDILSSALVSYLTKDTEPIKEALRAVFADGKLPDDWHPADTLSSMAFIDDLENPDDALIEFPYFLAAALDYENPDDDFKLVPLMSYLMVNDDDLTDEYEELGIWLIISIAHHLDTINPDGDTEYVSELLKAWLEIPEDYEEISKEELKAWLDNFFI